MDRDPLSPQGLNPAPPSGSHLNNYAIIKALVIGLVGITFCAILILLLLVCLYAIVRRSVYSRSGGSSWLRRREDASIFRATIRGLDPKLVEALPKIVYTSQNLKGHEKIECTICLSDFEEGEKVRVLPNCKHSFHIECIDMWFSSHSNCPVCRTGVEPHKQAVVVDGNRDDGCSANGSDNNVVVVNIGVIEKGRSSGVGIEEGSNSFSSPRVSEEISSPSASHSGRFSRLHSLKRMLSRGREEKNCPSLYQSPTESQGPSHC